MPSTVADIFTAAGVRPAGVERWGTPPGTPERAEAAATGIYVVALTPHLDRMDGAVTQSPVAAGAVAELLSARPELKLDGSRPTRDELAARLRAFWCPDEVVLYIGRAGVRKRRPAGGEVAGRVDEYYVTPLGAGSPHKGGWPLKTLACLDELSVHYGYCTNDKDAEDAALQHFATHLSDATRAILHDSERIMPFANLEFPKNTRKHHGISGAYPPKQPSPANGTDEGTQ